MTLGEKQQRFAELEASWVLWVIAHPGWKLRQGEGRILQLGPDGKRGRKSREVTTGKTVYVRDLVHLDGGTHYLGVSKDWQLFIDGAWVSNGDHPAWKTCGEHWKSLDPQCRWGGDFSGNPDANHISMLHNGMA